MRKNYDLEKRKYVIGGFILLIALIYLVRLFDLQIQDSKYKRSADTNAFLKKTVYPSRGLIYDRNGELVVYNQPAYDVMLIPRDVEPFDTARLLPHDKHNRGAARQAFRRHERQTPQPRLLVIHAAAPYLAAFVTGLRTPSGETLPFPRILHTETHPPAV